MLATRTETNAVLAAIVATGVTTGDAHAKGLSAPYCVLYIRPEGGYSGTLGLPELKHEAVYQASCVGKTRDQSQWVADKVSGVLDSLTISGRLVGRVHPEGSPGTFRDDDVDPPLFVTPLIFRVTSTS